MNLLITAASENAASMGFGVSDLNAQQFTWVLSRMHWELERPILCYEKVTIRTWPKNIMRTMFLRDFEILAENGSVIGRVVSIWPALNTVTGKPETPNPTAVDKYLLNKNRHAMDLLPRKIKPITQGNQRFLEVTYFDLDFNQHVTSSRYIDWMLDSFSVSFHQNHYPKKLSVNYLKEVRVGEKLVLLNTEQDNVHILEGRNSNTGEVAFRGEIVFEETE